ncbi:MAG: hypothetical protein RSB91_03615 [Clostridia bacterium]
MYRDSNIIRLRRQALLLLFALVALLLLPALAFADDAGVLSENELNRWVTQVLHDSAEEQPLNAPVGEEALTEDGYAFLYSFATLYYDKPVLDKQSVLCAIAVTDEAYASPRDVKLGSDANLLLDSYGWQNPSFMGDGTFASFYRLNELPRAAYWSWAQHEGDTLQTVQCAIHVTNGADRYTDAGMFYTVENNKITGIRAYGLNALTDRATVEKNLASVRSVEAAGSGDELDVPLTPAKAAVGYAVKGEQPQFGQADLQFDGIDFLALTENGAKLKFGSALSEERVQDDTGAQLLTTKRDGLSLSYTQNGDASMRMDAMSITKDILAGPRGVRIGAALSDVLAAFASDGEGRVNGSTAVLYGDGITAPTGFMERADERTVELQYLCSVTQRGETRVATLRMTFTDERLNEMLIYTW